MLKKITNAKSIGYTLVHHNMNGDWCAVLNILHSELTEDKRTPVRVRNVFAVFDFDALG